MTGNKDARSNQTSTTQDLSSLIQKLNEVIEQYKAENPDIDVEAILSKQKELQPILGLLQNRELDKFITYAKGQGTKMPFQAMEMGVLAAGRKDMQNGLAEILDSLKFDKPVCPECNDEMDDRGRSKKNS
jgi:hypothetical protein